MAVTIRSSTSGRVGTRGLRGAISGNRAVAPAFVEDFRPPSRPHENIIPSPNVLEALIRRALDALARGIYWERGSIINLVV